LPSNHRFERAVNGVCRRAASALRYVALASRRTHLRPAAGSDDPTKAAFPFLYAHALTEWGAKFGNPTIFAGLVEWADRIITE
jgi:hypothetical protein